MQKASDFISDSDVFQQMLQDAYYNTKTWAEEDFVQDLLFRFEKDGLNVLLSKVQYDIVRGLS